VTDDLERFERKKKLIGSLVPKKVVPKRKSEKERQSEAGAEKARNLGGMSKKERQLEAEAGRLRNIEKKKKKALRIEKLKSTVGSITDPLLKKRAQAELLNLTGKAQQPSKKAGQRKKISASQKNARQLTKIAQKLKLDPKNQVLRGEREVYRLKNKLILTRLKLKRRPTNEDLISNVQHLRRKILKKELEVTRYKLKLKPTNKTLIARRNNLRRRLARGAKPKSGSVWTVSGGLPSLGKR